MQFTTDSTKANNKVRVAKILDIQDAKHLSGHIGKSGEVWSWFKIGNDYKYKVHFQDGETHYFFEDELEIND